MQNSFLAPDLELYNDPSYHGQIRIEPEVTIPVQFKFKAEHVGLDKSKEIDPAALFFHTRSYLAQAGIFFQPDLQLLTSEALDKLRAGETVVTPGSMQNLGPCARIVKTDGDTRVGRFLYMNEADRITGEKLTQTVQLGKSQHVDKNVQSIVLELSPEDELLVTEHDEIVVLDGSRETWINHTKQLPLALQKGEPAHAFSLCVTTDVVTIPSGYFGWIQEQTTEPGVRHLKSQLLEPGTDWRVRVELLAEGASQRIPKAVYLNLYRVDDYPARTDCNTFRVY